MLFYCGPNEFDTWKLDIDNTLSAYKGQSTIEGGCKFIKSNTFEVSSVFLKKARTHRSSDDGDDMVFDGGQFSRTHKSNHSNNTNFAQNAAECRKNISRQPMACVHLYQFTCITADSRDEKVIRLPIK